MNLDTLCPGWTIRTMPAGMSASTLREVLSAQREGKLPALSETVAMLADVHLARIQSHLAQSGLDGDLDPATFLISFDSIARCRYGIGKKAGI